MKKLITLFFAVILFAKTNAQNFLPILKTSHKFEVSQEGWEKFQTKYENDLEDGETTLFNCSEKIWIKQLVSNWKKMTGEIISADQMRKKLISSKTKFSWWPVGDLNKNFGVNKTTKKIEPCHFKKSSNEDNSIGVIEFEEEDGTIVPFLKWQGGEDGTIPCGNPILGDVKTPKKVTKKKIVKKEEEECDPDTWKIVKQQQVEYTLWRLWKNDCGKTKSDGIRTTPVVKNCGAWRYDGVSDYIDPRFRYKKYINDCGEEKYEKYKPLYHDKVRDALVTETPAQNHYAMGKYRVEVRDNIIYRYPTNTGIPHDANPGDGSSNPFNKDPITANPGDGSSNPFNNGTNTGTGNTNPSQGNSGGFPVGG